MCGPFIAATMNGMVRNGPTPTMLMMLVAVAWSRPMARRSAGAGARPWVALMTGTSAPTVPRRLRRGPASGFSAQRALAIARACR